VVSQVLTPRTTNVRGVFVSLDMEKINLAEKLAKIDDHWHPRVISELNGQHVKLAKLKGEFVWHHHETEDEMFLVIKGQLLMAFRDQMVSLGPGEMIVVPRGIEHKPIAEKEVEVMLFEPSTTLNTGNTRNELTRDTLNKL